MNQIADQYARVELEMDEDMVNEDDLLDQTLEEEARVPETQFATDTDIIRANKPSDGALQDDGETQILHRRTYVFKERVNAKSETKKNTREMKVNLPSSNVGKRRGTQSPDTKGITASKKLATRGRASPKGKLVKHNDSPL